MKLVLLVVAVLLASAHAVDLKLGRRVSHARARFDTDGTVGAFSGAAASPIAFGAPTAPAAMPGAPTAPSTPGTPNLGTASTATRTPGAGNTAPNANAGPNSPPPPPGGTGAAANDNNKQGANKEPTTGKFTVVDKVLKIIGSSMQEIPNDPVRKILGALPGVQESLKSILHLSQADFSSVRQKVASRAPLSSGTVDNIMIAKLRTAPALSPGALASRTKPAPITNAGTAILLEETTDPKTPAPATTTPGAGNAPPAAAAPKITCSWSESQTKSPETQARTPAQGALQQEGDYIWYNTERGPGGWTAVTNQRRCQKSLFSLSQYCRCARTSKDASSGRGQIDVNVQITCVEEKDGKKRFVPPPAECRTVLRVQMSYQGRAWVVTDGGTCIPFGASMEAIATNEVMGKINDQDAILKAGSVQTGNKVTTEISYQFNVKASGKAGEAVSGEVGASFGYTEKIEKNYGEKSADIVGFVTKDITAANNHALSAHLETNSRVSITGESYAWANGVAQSLGMGIWYAGTSDCPGIDKAAVGWLVLGVPELEAELTKQAQKFTDTYKTLPK